jgi:thiol-disulfide isomerase/thioredoxin
MKTSTLGALWLAGCAALLSSCSGAGQGDPAEDAYRVEIAMPEAEGLHVALRQIRFDRPLQKTLTLIDSGRLGSGGSLVLEGKLPEPIIAELVVKGMGVPVVLEPGRSYRLEGASDQPASWTWAAPLGADALHNLSQRWEADYIQLSRLGSAYEQALRDGLSSAQLDSLGRVREQAIEAYWAGIRRFVDTTSSPLMGYFAVESLDWPSNFETIRAFSNRMLARMPSSVYSRDLQSRIVQWESKMLEQAQTPSFVGKLAPELSGLTPDGRSVRLSELKGKYVLVDFWASWCAPCRRENPNIVRQYRRYKDRGFTVFSVSLDRDAAAWVNGLRADSLAWPYHIREADFGGPMSTAYGIKAIPAGFLVNPEGVIDAEHRELRGENLVRRLEMLLGP